MDHNIFNTAHKPLKLALLTTCISVSGKRRYTAKESSDMVSTISGVLAVFKEQVNFENEGILPLIFEYEPSICNHYHAQHEQQMERVEALEGLIHSFKVTKSDVDRFYIIIKLEDLFNQFLLNNYHHMDDEEEVLNKILWQYYDGSFLERINYPQQSKYERKQNVPPANLLRTATAA